MTRFIAIVVFAVGLSACGEKTPTDIVDSLVANPERLKALRVQCKADRASVGDAVCNAISEATRRRFMGSGTPYTPKAQPVDSEPKD